MANIENEFDKEEQFREAAMVHIEELEKICAELRIPFFACYLVSSVPDENGKFHQSYVRSGRTPASYNKKIQCKGTDEVSKHYAVSAGARVFGDIRDDDESMDIENYESGIYGDPEAYVGIENKPDAYVNIPREPRQSTAEEDADAILIED